MGGKIKSISSLPLSGWVACGRGNIETDCIAWTERARADTRLKKCVDPEGASRHVPPITAWTERARAHTHPPMKPAPLTRHLTEGDAKGEGGGGGHLLAPVLRARPIRSATGAPQQSHKGSPSLEMRATCGGSSINFQPVSVASISCDGENASGQHAHAQKRDGGAHPFQKFLQRTKMGRLHTICEAGAICVEVLEES